MTLSKQGTKALFSKLSLGFVAVSALTLVGLTDVAGATNGYGGGNNFDFDFSFNGVANVVVMIFNFVIG